MLWSPKRTAILVVALVIPSSALLAQPNRIGARIDDTRRVVLSGSLHSRAQPPSDLGPVEPSVKIGYITLMLKPSASQQSTLEQLLQEQQDRSSPNYHRWLTPDHFGDRFGLSQSDYAAVVSWVESKGLHVDDQARARNWVAFSGTASQVSNAFQTEIHRYLVNGETHFANATALRIPSALDNVVSGVRGLNDFWQRPGPKPEFTTSSGTHQLAPDDWATIYDVTPLYNMGIDGTGQRLVILGRSDTNQAYVDAFRSMFGLPPSQIEMHLIGPDPGVTNAYTRTTSSMPPRLRSIKTSRP
jgi:subtilase family serine protease